MRSVLQLSPFALLVLCACGDAPDVRAPSAPQTEGAAEANAPPPASEVDDAPVRVELLGAGDGAKRPLRYVFHPGRSEAMAMDMTMTFTMSSGDKRPPALKLPRVHMAMGITPKLVLPNGDVVYRYDVKAADVADDPDSKPGTIASMRAQIHKLTGLAGEVEVTARGCTVRATMEPRASLDPGMRDVIDQVKSSLRDLSAPLPEDAVGIGATWKAVAPFKMRGIHATRAVTYRLKALEGDHASLDVGFEITADAQPIENKELPPGTALTLVALKAGGTGTMGVDLQTLVPTSQASVDSTADTSVEANGEKRPLSVVTKLDLTIAPGAP